MQDITIPLMPSEYLAYYKPDQIIIMATNSFCCAGHAEGDVLGKPSMWHLFKAWCWTPSVQATCLAWWFANY